MSSTYKFSPGLFLDIELPSTAQDGSTRPPVIVWGHGGGWRLHDRTARPNFARAFAPQGFAMVSIYYRLAPAGTIHSFSFHTHNTHNTHMLGILTTPLFEKFFEYMNVPSNFAVQEEGTEPWFPAEGCGKAQAELDLTVVGPPPQH